MEPNNCLLADDFSSFQGACSISVLVFKDVTPVNPNKNLIVGTVSIYPQIPDPSKVAIFEDPVFSFEMEIESYVSRG